MARVIGIRHRRKATAEGEARPTLVAVKTLKLSEIAELYAGKDDANVVQYELDDDTAELDFLMGRFPVEHRKVEPDEDVSQFQPHHCKWRKVKSDEDVRGLNLNHMRKRVDAKGLPVVEVITKVPVKFDGLQEGDRVGMVLGGSGDRFAAALSRRGETVGATVSRIPPFSIAAKRGEQDKEQDPLLLIELLENGEDLFYLVRRRDRDLIRVKEALAARQDALKQRIACEQRILQSLVGLIFLREDGHYPEGVIELQFDDAKANDNILQALIKEEDRRDKELAKLVKGLDIWNQILESVPGVGPRLAAGIIAPIGDIRRFMVLGDGWQMNKGKAKLKKFCGVHVLPNGKFPRRRTGEVANWNPSARQALYLLADQFNRRPDSVWGKKLLHYKLVFRERHPDVLVVDGKKRYTNGHIHKMALWRTVTKFVEWLYREWAKMEGERAVMAA